MRDGLADDDRSRFAQTLHSGRFERRRKARVHLRAGFRRHVGRVEQVLDPDGNTVDWASVDTAGTLLVGRCSGGTGLVRGDVRVCVDERLRRVDLP
jgi:hypothetical protein